jgi:hypothetical protein
MTRLNKIVFAVLLIVAVGAASCNKNYYTSKAKATIVAARIKKAWSVINVMCN